MTIHEIEKLQRRDQLITGTAPDNPGDCLRRAVCIAYGHRLDELPDPPADDSFWPTWDAWAANLGLKWWVSGKFAPVSLERWIAGVPALAEGEAFHAVVMGGQKFLVDPNALDFTRSEFVHGAAPLHEIMNAMALMPIEDEDLATAVEPIGGTRDSENGRIIPTATLVKDQRFVSYGIQGREYDSGNSLILAATSMGTSGYSGSSTAAQTSVQTLTKSGTISGGTWALSFEGYTFSASFAYNASIASIQAAIDAAMGAGLFTVGGTTLNLGNMTFTGAGSLASQYVPPLTFTSSLTGGGTVTLSTTTAGYPAYVSAALYSSWSAICDTGNLAHVGDYRVIARVYDNASTSDTYKSSIRLKWSLGDLTNLQTNDPVTPQAVGGYALVDLGQIHVPTAPTGTQRWSGIIEGKTSGTAGSTFRVVYLAFYPIGTGSGEVRAISDDSGSLSMSDDFNRAAAAYTGQSMDVGGAVSGGGDADDLSTLGVGSSSLYRAATSDTSNTGRYVYAGSAVTNCSASVLLNGIRVQATTRAGLLLRYVNSTNYAFAVLHHDGSSPTLRVYKKIGGSVSLVASANGSQSSQTITATVRSDGSFSLRDSYSNGLSGFDSEFATGGTLASGKLGIYDENTNASAGGGQLYNSFRAYSLPTPNAAIYAGRSLEFRTNEVLREVSGGGVYSPPAISSQPFQPELTPAGAEGITNRVLAGMSRNNPDEGGDPLSDAFTLTIYYEPTWAFARSTQ